MLNTILRKRLAAKKNRGKGFTLIEVIVVIVILAILASIAVPALTGYIDKARDRSALAEAHNIMVALQAVATDAYAAGAPLQAALAVDAKIYDDGPTILEEVQKLSGDPAITADQISGIAYDGSKLLKFTYITSDGAYSVSYDASKTPVFEVSAV